VTALVDGKGRALQLALTPGQRHDQMAAMEIGIPESRQIVGDKRYDGNELRERIEERGSQHCIPARNGRKEPASHRKSHYKKRPRLANIFERVKRHRQIATRYEKLALHFLAFLHLVAVLEWLKAL